MIQWKPHFIVRRWLSSGKDREFGKDYVTFSSVLGIKSFANTAKLYSAEASVSSVAGTMQGD